MPTAPPVTEVADGVYRCGTKLVNWHLVSEDGRLTVVDAGLPGYWPQLDAALGELGHSREDVAALVLTHAHSDHVGFAERLRTEASVPVWIHEADAEMARTGKPQASRDSGNVLSYLRFPAALGFLAHFTRNGGARIPPLGEVRTFSDGEVLDIPGRPRAILAPGHTEGLCALRFEGRGVMVLGDVLCNRHPLTGRSGPQVMPRPFNVDTGQAIRSLDRIVATSESILLFGHGDPWHDGADEAVDRARATGPT